MVGALAERRCAAPEYGSSDPPVRSFGTICSRTLGVESGDMGTGEASIGKNDLSNNQMFLLSR
jgi:hypothetical protein